MFLLAVLGNVTYGFSILVRNLDGNYVLKHLPWLVGSLGVVFLDLAVSFQIYKLHVTGFPQALEIMENLEITKKSYMHGKIMEFEKNLNNHGKIMKFCEYFDETTSSQKTSCQTHKNCVSDS